MTDNFKTWDQYVDEAKIPPFQLQVSPDETVVIEAPTGAAFIQFNSAARAQDAEAMLAAIGGEQWPRLRELLGTGSHKAMDNLLADLMVHFDIAPEVDLVSPDGGRRTEKDPRKVRKLQKAGWRPVGEARSRT